MSDPMNETTEITDPIPKSDDESTQNNKVNKRIMTPGLLKISGFISVFYQLFIFKYFPFLPKNRVVSYLQKIDNKKLQVFTIIMIQIIFRTTMVYLFELAYKLRCLDKWKSQPNKKWAFEENKEKYEKNRYETYYYYFTRLVPSVLLCLPLVYKSSKNIRVDRKFPSIFEMFYQINCSMLIVDMIFYLVHRFIFHHKDYYVHHKDHHTYINSTVHASLRMSVIDYFSEIIIPGMMGPRIFDMHYFTYILYLITGNVVGIMSHAGYTFPFKPLNMMLSINELMGESNNINHEIHHNVFNKNFSAATLLPDLLLKTNHKKSSDDDL